MENDWAIRKRIFDAALRLNPADRPAFLDTACDENETLRREVEELLAGYDEAGGFLDEEEPPPPHAPVFAPGDKVDDRFRVVRLISRGGMGEVYEVFDEKLSIRLALKTLRPEFRADQDALDRFRREIRVTRDFAHPNLCRAYELVEHHRPAADGGEDQIITCLSMQLLEGETLQEYLARRKKPLAYGEALAMIRQIGEAIDTLHASGLIHRDLKPSNIMVTRTPSGALRMMVMDFGLAKPAVKGWEMFESRSDFHAGAPFYLAPELIRGEKPSPSSDIYAFGLIIDEMVTETRPYSGDSIEAILYQKVWGTLTDPALRAPGLPETWARAIRRCLHRDPELRYRTAREVVDDLELSVAEHSPFVRRVLTLFRQARRGLSRLRPFRVRVLAPAIAAPIVLALAALVLLGSRAVTTSVFVFPIENRTANPDLDYLGEGTVEEVKRRLQSIAGLTVVSYKDQIPKGFRPSTDYFIQGQLVSPEQGGILSMKLVENKSGRVLWMRDLTGAVERPTLTQSEIASGMLGVMRDAVLLPLLAGREGPSKALLTVLHPIRDRLVPAAQKPAPAPTIIEPAMVAYMRGKSEFQRDSKHTVDESIRLYQEALRLDSRFSLAYSGLAFSETKMLQFNVAPREELQSLARQYAQMAVTTKPDSAEAYTALAAVHQNDWDWKGAEQNYRRAISLDPKFALAHRWYAGLLAERGLFDDSLKQVQLAMQAEPYDPSSQSSWATYLNYAGRTVEAQEYLEKRLQTDDWASAHEILTWIYIQRAEEAGNTAEQERFLDLAEKQARIVTSQESENPAAEYSGRSLPLLALIYGLRGDRVKGEFYRHQMEIACKQHKNSAQELAAIYVAVGRHKEALELLRRGIYEKDCDLLEFRIDPLLKPIRTYPEFRELVKMAGL